MDRIYNAGQWQIKLNDVEEDKCGSYEITNPDKEGNSRFYSVVSGEKHQEPLSIKEPAKAYSIPESVALVKQAIGSSIDELLYQSHSPEVRPKVCGIYLKLPVIVEGVHKASWTIFRSSLSNRSFEYGELLETATRFTVSITGIVNYISQAYKQEEEQQRLILQSLSKYMHVSQVDQASEFSSQVTTKDPKVTGFLTHLGEYDVNRYVEGNSTSGVFHLVPSRAISSVSGRIESGDLPVIHDEFSELHNFRSDHWLVKSHSQ